MRLAKLGRQMNDIVQQELPLKVDKITGKGLSTNDYDNIEKLEVAKIKDKAEKTYVDALTASLASGSPKGTYATLTALQTAFPTGNANIYVVTADGKWYYWNGTAWTAGGVYQSTGIAPNSITPNMLAYYPLKVTALKANNYFTVAPIIKTNVDTTLTLTFKSGLILLMDDGTVMTCSSDFSVSVPSAYCVSIKWIAGAGTITSANIVVEPRASFAMATGKYPLFYNTSGRLYSYVSEFSTYLGALYNDLIDNSITFKKLVNPIFNIMPTKTLLTLNPNSIQEPSADITVTFPAGHLIMSDNVEWMNNSADFSVVIPNGNYCVLTWTPGSTTLSPSTVTAIPPGSFSPAYNKIVLFYNANGRLYSDIPAYAAYLERLYFKSSSAKEVIVDINGKGDYTSVVAAVASEPENTVIRIMPGVYDGTIEAFTKRIILIGTDRNECILRSTDGRYEKPVINGSCGYIENLTLYHQYVNGVSNEIDGITSGGYAFHCENEYGVGKKLEFHHCTLKSDFFPALGMGLRKDFTCIIDDCELINNQVSGRGNYSTTGSLGALYFHDTNGEVGNQYIKVKDTVMRSSLEKALCVYDLQKAGNTVYCEFINNTIYSEINGFSNAIYWRGQITPFDGNFELDGISHGNTDTNLNNI